MSGDVPTVRALRAAAPIAPKVIPQAMPPTNRRAAPPPPSVLPSRSNSVAGTEGLGGVVLPVAIETLKDLQEKASAADASLAKLLDHFGIDVLTAINPVRVSSSLLPAAPATLIPIPSVTATEASPTVAAITTTTRAIPEFENHVASPPFCLPLVQVRLSAKSFATS